MRLPPAPGADPAATVSPGPSESVSPLQSAVERILASQAFERTHRLSALLRYLADHTTSGDTAGLKEPIIGQRVFGRPADYIASDDNIVRSNVRQLRLKLEEYYSSEGEKDPWRISVPKGSYLLKLEPALQTRPPALLVRPWRLPDLIAVPAVLLAVVALVWWLRTLGPQPKDCLLSLLRPGPGQRLLVIGSDANVQLYVRLTRRRVTLQEYIDGRYQESGHLPPGMDQAMFSSLLASRSVTETIFLNILPEFARALPTTSLSVLAADSITTRDFDHDNAVLISGPFGNPWVQMFDRDLNFQIEANEEVTTAWVHNRKPIAGEQEYYRNYTDASKTIVCYARLAYLPGPRPGSHIMLTGGPHHASTQAAGQFLTRADSLESIRRQLHVHRSEPVPWFEAVVESRTLSLDPISMRIVAIRRVESPNVADTAR